MRKLTRGQSLAEYGVLAGVVAIGAIAALGLVANQMAITMPGLGNTMMGSGQSILPETSGGAGGNGQIGSSASSMPSQTVCYGSGVCVSVTTIDDNWQETAGGMGGNLTKSLADTLKELADKLEGSGDGFDDAFILQKIRELANMGHAIGDEQLHLANGIGAHCPTADCILQNPAQFDDILPDQHVNGVPTELEQFSTAFAELQGLMAASGGSLDPAIVALVNQQAGTIQTLGEETPWVTVGAGMDGPSPEAAGGSVVTVTLNGPSNNAELTHQSGNTICGAASGGSACTVSTGGGSSSGGSATTAIVTGGSPGEAAPPDLGTGAGTGSIPGFTGGSSAIPQSGTGGVPKSGTGAGSAVTATSAVPGDEEF